MKISDFREKNRAFTMGKLRAFAGRISAFSGDFGLWWGGFRALAKGFGVLKGLEDFFFWNGGGLLASGLGYHGVAELLASGLGGGAVF